MKNLLKLTVLALSIFAVAQVEACPANTVQVKYNNGTYGCEGLGGNPACPAGQVLTRQYNKNSGISYVCEGLGGNN